MHLIDLHYVLIFGVREVGGEIGTSSTEDVFHLTANSSLAQSGLIK